MLRDGTIDVKKFTLVTNQQCSCLNGSYVLSMLRIRSIVVNTLDCQPRIRLKPWLITKKKNRLPGGTSNEGPVRHCYIHKLKNKRSLKKWLHLSVHYAPQAKMTKTLKWAFAEWASFPRASLIKTQPPEVCNIWSKSDAERPTHVIVFPICRLF